MDTNFENVSVIYITSEEQTINYKWFPEGKQFARMKGFMIQSENETFDDDIVNMPSNYSSGDVLIRDPYETVPTFVSSDGANMQVWKSKFSKIAEVLSLVGAKNCSFQFTSIKIEDIKRKGEIGGSYKLVKADVGAKQDIEKKLKQVLEMTREFESNQDVTKEQWEQAKQLAKSCHLWEESDIRSLINTRNPERANKGKSATLKIELSDMLNKSLEIASNLSISEIFSISAKVSQQISRQYNVIVAYNIEF